MRQYQIFYKRLGSNGFAPLIPNVHAPLYGRQDVKEAVMLMRDKPQIEGLSIRSGDEQFNIIASDQEDLVPNGFEFPQKLVGLTNAD